jgi:hypothetical protein
MSQAVRQAMSRAVTGSDGVPGRGPGGETSGLSAGRPGPARGGPQSSRRTEASTRTIVLAARSRSSATAIRSAHDHQNHQMPSRPQPA